MIDALVALPSHVREQLAHAFESGHLPLRASRIALEARFGLKDGAEELHRGLQELDRLCVSAEAVAAWLRAIGRVAASRSTPRLVWSGPRVAGVPARDTRTVYEQLLGGAVESLWVSTYAYFDGPTIFEGLAKRLDAVPSLNVRLLLNIQRGKADTTSADSLVRRFADDFWGMDWPGASRPKVYYDARSLALDRPAAVLHAKAVVADGEAVFVTSANLTDSAWDENIELGILAHDHALATSVTAHFQGLIDGEVLKVLPTK